MQLKAGADLRASFSWEIFGSREDARAHGHQPGPRRGRGFGLLPRGFGSSWVRARSRRAGEEELAACPGPAGRSVSLRSQIGSNSFDLVNKRLRPGSRPTTCALKATSRMAQNQDLTPLLQLLLVLPQVSAAKPSIYLFFPFCSDSLHPRRTAGYGKKLSLFLGLNPWGLGLGFAQGGQPGPTPLHCAARPGSPGDKRASHLRQPSKMPLEYKY